MELLWKLLDKESCAELRVKGYPRLRKRFPDTVFIFLTYQIWIVQDHLVESWRLKIAQRVIANESKKPRKVALMREYSYAVRVALAENVSSVRSKQGFHGPISIGHYQNICISNYSINIGNKVQTKWYLNLYRLACWTRYHQNLTRESWK